MTDILGYGEDSLTLWYLTKKLDVFLCENSDNNSNPKDCLLMYRPSMGRGVWYGEFDAILVGPKVAYLVESKWTKTGKHKPLNDAQRKRHEILQWFLKNMNERVVESDKDWEAFRAEKGSDFEGLFRGKKISGAGSLLSRNVRRIVKNLKIKGITSENQINNIILLFSHKDSPIEQTEEGFKIIKVVIRPETTEGWVGLNL